MANVFVPDTNDAAVFTTDKFGPLKDGDGKTYRTVVKTNVNGNYDVYSKGTGGFGGDELLYQYNASSNQADFRDGKFKDKPETAYNSFFNSKSGNAAGFNNNVKKTWYGEAPPNSAQRMATLDGYKSIAATVPIRQAQSNVPGGSLTIQTSQGPVTTSVPTDPNAFNLSQSASGADDVNKLKLAIGDGSIRETYGDYYYPKPFPKEQDRIKFSMFRYSPKSLDTANFAKGSTFGSRQPKEIKGSVTLPIQPQISDTSSVDWGNDDMNALSALAAMSSYNSITKGGEGVIQSIDDIVKGLKGTTGSLATAAAASLAGAAAGGNKNFLSRATGAVLNPNLELLFNGPQLRTFSFNFTLSAREDDEAKEIKKIIRFFKQGMSVKRADTGLFLKAPNIFDVRYILGSGNKDHPWINKIKTCALVNFSVDYTPAGNYATFYDGAMTQYNLTMSFSELDPIFDDDYAEADKSVGGGLDSSIGY